MIPSIFFLAAATTQDCGALQDVLLQDRCQLEQSMRMSPPPDCKRLLTQVDMNVCSFRDYLRADIVLNETWAAVASKTFQPAKTRHRDAQRKWLAFRDAQCLAENGPRDESGTIWALRQNSCLTGLTEARTKQLREHLKTER